MDYSFTRYLAAKKTIDDRALNHHVWQTMVDALPAAAGSLQVIEAGAGIGTMVERLWERGVLTDGSYTAVDDNPENIAVARRRLAALPKSIDLTLRAADVFEFIAARSTQPPYDLLIAHAFLDLLHLPSALPQLFSLLSPGGLYYFTINFDGGTILQPSADQAFDAHIESLYHRTMDERITHGRPSGDSRTGRHLFQLLPAAGATIMAAGSSDWVVAPSAAGYAADEAYFLHFIIHTIESALQGHPQLDAERFAAWVKRRHAQIEAAELVYIAHQLDFVGRFQGAEGR